MGGRALRLGFGVAATVPRDVLQRLAAMLDGLGYDDAWSNDLGPGGRGDGLDALAALRAGAAGIRLGLGVAALDRRPPADLVHAAGDVGLAADPAVVLGVGAGSAATPRRVVRDGVPRVRAAVAGRVGVAAMGPRMCRLAGEVADVVLLNWMTPERLRWARARVTEGAEGAGRSPGDLEVAAYVRVALGGTEASRRLAAEAARYAAIPHYGRHFAAMGVDPGSVGVVAADDAGLREELAPYRAALDTLVVRALPAGPTLEAHAEIAEAAR